MNFDTWQCPKCGFLISDVQLQSARFDYGCPRCKTSFGEFVPRPATPSNKRMHLTLRLWAWLKNLFLGSRR